MLYLKTYMFNFKNKQNMLGDQEKTGFFPVLENNLNLKKKYYSLYFYNCLFYITSILLCLNNKI